MSSGLIESIETYVYRAPSAVVPVELASAAQTVEPADDSASDVGAEGAPTAATVEAAESGSPETASADPTPAALAEDAQVETVTETDGVSDDASH